MADDERVAAARAATIRSASIENANYWIGRALL
jgi:hypothetical protein